MVFQKARERSMAKTPMFSKWYLGVVGSWIVFICGLCLCRNFPGAKTVNSSGNRLCRCIRSCQRYKKCFWNTNKRIDTSSARHVQWKDRQYHMQRKIPLLKGLLSTGGWREVIYQQWRYEISGVWQRKANRATTKERYYFEELAVYQPVQQRPLSYPAFFFVLIKMYKHMKEHIFIHISECSNV